MILIAESVPSSSATLVWKVDLFTTGLLPTVGK
jgi:hypothetical protein